MPVFIQRRPRGGHGIRVYARIQPHADIGLQQRVRESTRQLNDVLEDQVRRNLAEWVWWHGRGRCARPGQVDLDQPFPYTGATTV